MLYRLKPEPGGWLEEVGNSKILTGWWYLWDITSGLELWTIIDGEIFLQLLNACVSLPEAVHISKIEVLMISLQGQSFNSKSLICFKISKEKIVSKENTHKTFHKTIWHTPCHEILKGTIIIL